MAGLTFSSVSRTVPLSSFTTRATARSSTSPEPPASIAPPTRRALPLPTTITTTTRTSGRLELRRPELSLPQQPQWDHLHEFSEGARVLGTSNGFATWFFDYDNDGRDDLFATSYAPSLDEMVRGYLGLPINATTMRLYHNVGDGSFRDVSTEAGLKRALMPMGANFGDLDNDGSTWPCAATLPTALSPAACSSATQAGAPSSTSNSLLGNWRAAPRPRRCLCRYGQRRRRGYRVRGRRHDTGDRHALRLFENPGHGNDWLALKLVGVKTNRSAVGARITVKVTDAAGQIRTIHRTVGTEARSDPVRSCNTSVWAETHGRSTSRCGGR